MTVGNVVALWQNNLRRLLAYSSIAHAGYMLVGLAAYLASDMGAVPKWDGVGALLFYLLAYVLATTGAFAVLNCLGRGHRPIEDVEELTGLAWTGGPVRTVLAWTLALCMFSLTGIPPLAGFWGKLGIFLSALGAGRPGSVVQPWLVALAVIGVVNSAIAAAYYLRIVGLMFFRLPLGTPTITRRGAGAFAAAMACGLMVLAVGLHPGPWINDAHRASPRPAVRAPQGGANTRLDRPKHRMHAYFPCYSPHYFGSTVATSTWPFPARGHRRAWRSGFAGSPARGARSPSGPRPGFARHTRAWSAPPASARRG